MGLGVLGGDRARLQAKAWTGFDGVFSSIENAVEPPVYMGHMIATVEIIVDEDLPITVELVSAPLRPVELCKTQQPNPSDQIGAEELF